MRRAGLPIALLILSFFAGRMLKSSPQKVDPPPQANTPTPTRTTTRSADATPAQTPADLSQSLRSTDTVDTLIALSKDDLYERLALWLVDASVEDMAAYWEATKHEEDTHYKIRDLLFVRWTITDPLGAIEAASKTSSAHIPWWAWAKNDPQAAFNHSIAHGHDQIAWVMRSIGQSNPDLALKLLKSHPDLPPETGMDGIIFGLTRDDPEAAINHLHQQGNFYDSKPLESWLREDPHAAFDWFVAHKGEFGHYNENQEQALIGALTRENPDLLTEFATKLPIGSFRRKLESAAFDLLIAKDPEKALAQAKSNPSTRLKTQQLAKIALAETDPGKARELLAQLAEINPNFIYYETRTSYPNGNSSSTYLVEEGKQLIRQLAEDDPRATLDLLFETNGEDSWNPTNQEAASVWINRDPEAFASWASAISDPYLRTNTYYKLVNSLSESGNYEDALRHASNLGESQIEGTTRTILSKWKYSNPVAAAAWAKSNGIELP
jgi:hypothetical protein